MKIAIIGAGGMGREILALIQTINNKEEGAFHFVGWYDDNKDIGELVNDFPVLGKIEDLNEIKEDLSIAMAIGFPKVKSQILSKIDNPFLNFPNLIHPSVENHSFQRNIFGKGIIIQANSSLTTNIKIEDFVFISPNCSIGHDSIIKEFSSVMPGVSIAGNVEVQERAFLGIKSCTIQGVKIKKDATIGAGATVIKDTEEGLTYVGTPALPILK